MPHRLRARTLTDVHYTHLDSTPVTISKSINETSANVKKTASHLEIDLGTQIE